MALRKNRFLRYLLILVFVIGGATFFEIQIQEIQSTQTNMSHNVEDSGQAARDAKSAAQRVASFVDRITDITSPENLANAKAAAKARDQISRMEQALCHTTCPPVTTTTTP